jgi:hypothetical protein
VETFLTLLVAIMNVWVKFQDKDPLKVPTKECGDVDDLLKKCRRELSPLLDSISSVDLLLSTMEHRSPLRRDLPLSDIPGILKNTFEIPLLLHTTSSFATAVSTSTSTVLSSTMPLSTQDGTVENTFTSYDFLTEFVEFALKLTSADLEEGRVIPFPLTDLFDCSVDLENGVYVRLEYVSLTQRIEEYQKRYVNRKTRRCLVLGTPGIGKSMFGVYFILRQLSLRQNIAYSPLDKTTFVYITFKDCHKPHIGEKPIARDYVTIYDGTEHAKSLIDSRSSIMILLSSPRASNYNQFKKLNCQRFYLNPWSRSEFFDFVEKCNIESEDLQRRFNVVGGVPRYVHSFTLFLSKSNFSSHLLGSFDSSDLFEQLQSAIPEDLASLKTDVWRVIINSPVSCKVTAHLPYNLWRKEDTTATSTETFSLEYSSRISEVLISTRFQIQSREELLRILKTPDKDLQTWRGHQLESMMLLDLSLGKHKYTSRSLEPAQTDDFVFPMINSEWGAIRSASIQEVSEIQVGMGKCMYLPISITFPAIDGLIILDEPGPGIILYIQCTVSLKHPIFYQKLKNMYQKLHDLFPGHKHAFVFCVPKDCFDDFQVQSFRNENGKLRTTPRDIPIRQYVLQYE